jgi:hypothetical protein
VGAPENSTAPQGWGCVPSLSVVLWMDFLTAENGGRMLLYCLHKVVMGIIIDQLELVKYSSYYGKSVSCISSHHICV